MSNKKKAIIIGSLVLVLVLLVLAYVLLIARVPEGSQTGDTGFGNTNAQATSSNANADSNGNAGISPAEVGTGTNVNANENTGQGRPPFLERTDDIGNANANAGSIPSVDPHDPESEHGGYSEEKAAEMQREKEERRATADRVQEIAQGTQPSDSDTMDTMDRGQIHRSVADFTDAYFTSGDLASRAAKLDPMLDLDYIRDDPDGMLYKDYYQYPDRVYGFPDGYTYLYHDAVDIYNAKKGDLTATIPVHFLVTEQLHSVDIDGGMDRTEVVVTYKISLNDNYKIKAMKVIS